MERVKFFRTDWPQVRREALILLSILIAATGAIVASSHFHQAADRTLAAARTQEQNGRANLANVERERAELIASLAPYQELMNRAVLGDENRLQWRDTLAAAGRNAGMTKLGYSLSIQKSSPASAADMGHLKPHHSDMHLKVEFLRETAFVDFLEEISEKGRALPIVRACEIARAGEGSGGLLKAECLIAWTTLQRVTTTEGSPPQ